MTLTMTTSANNNDIEVIPINTPILPFYLGNTRVLESKHTFLHFIEFKPLILQFNIIKNLYTILEKSLVQNNVTKDFKENLHFTNSNNLIMHAQYLLSQLEIKLNNIKPRNRSKRGLINVGGKIAKWLFGTLDSDDGEKYDKAINDLRNSQNSYKNEIKMQTSLTKQLIEHYNNTIMLFTKNQNQIKRHIETFERNINKTIIDLTIFLRVQNTLLQIILNCQNFITFLDNLEDAIMFAKLNTLHSAVIQASDLQQIIISLTALYGENKIINFQNFENYYQLAGLEVRFINDKIIFAIHIPIFLKDNFKMYNLFPIPLNHTIIIPKSPYLIMSTDLQQYQEEDCPKIEDTYICENHLEAQKNECLTNLIKNAEIQNCQIIKAKITKSIFKSITNQYILIIPFEQNTKIYKNCSNKEILLISNPSLINIPLNCGIQIRSSQFWNKEEIIKGTPFSLPRIQFDGLHPHVIQQEALKLETIDIGKIKDLHDQAEALGKLENTPKSDSLTWSLSTLFGTILIILSIMFAVCQYLQMKRRLTRQKKQEEIPVEPNHPENNASPLFSSS